MSNLGSRMVRSLRRTIRRFGFDVVRHQGGSCDRFPPDFSAEHVQIFERVAPFTITTSERVRSLVEAVWYVLRNSIPGAIVECGVYKGGSMMAVAEALLSKGVRDRSLYLFDTFQGMPAPDARDIDFAGVPASATFRKRRLAENSSSWVNAPLEEVRRNMAATGYPEDLIQYVKGMVEDTLPGRAPGQIALLRLDTDWYQSTKHELVHLYPRVSRGGIVIIDDYGHFQGARDAVDEYFAESPWTPFLHRIDYSGRLCVKSR